MNKEIYDLLQNANEIVSDFSFGELLLLKINSYYEAGYISKENVKNIVNCLTDIDETRSVFDTIITDIVLHCIKGKLSIDILIDILQYNNEQFCNSKIQQTYFASLCKKLVSGEISLTEMLTRMREGNK